MSIAIRYKSAPFAQPVLVLRGINVGFPPALFRGDYSIPTVEIKDRVDEAKRRSLSKQQLDRTPSDRFTRV